MRGLGDTYVRYVHCDLPPPSYGRWGPKWVTEVRTVGVNRLREYLNDVSRIDESAENDCDSDVANLRE